MTIAKPVLATAGLLSVMMLGQAPAAAQALYYSDPAPRYQSSIFAPVTRQQEAVEETEGSSEIAAHLRRQIVTYETRERAGTIIVDTPNTYLYYVLGGGRAVRYGIGVGRDGFRWSGTQNVGRKAEWPDWNPPAEMIARQPYLPRFMAGGPTNPLGARALYLGNTIYRIHGTNAPSTIGGRVSSGCIRMLNDDVTDLYNRVNVGAKVVVLPDSRYRAPAIAKQIEPRDGEAGDFFEQQSRREARNEVSSANRSQSGFAIR